MRLTATAIIAATAFAASRGDRRIVAYLLVLAVVGAVVTVVHRRAPLTTNLGYALAACSVLHLLGGLVPSPDPHATAPVFYETWLVPHALKYDQLVHFTLSAVATAIAWHLTRRRVRAAVLALGAGIANEVFELVSSIGLGQVYAGDLTNAAWDLVFNGFGIAAALVFYATRSPAACASHVANMSA